MSVLDKSVHVQLDKHLEQKNLPEEIALCIVDTVEQLQYYQIRTVIMRGFKVEGERFYHCVQSYVDYTKFVHGEEEYETNLNWFNLPDHAIKHLALDHMCVIESQNKDYRSSEEFEHDWDGDHEEFVHR